jgi:hypothetical protein
MEVTVAMAGASGAQPCAAHCRCASAIGSNGRRRRSGTEARYPIPAESTEGAVAPGRRDPGHTQSGGYAVGVEVLISEGARDYIARHGGTVFVRSHAHRCCTGLLTLLDVRTSPPTDAANFEPFDTGGVGVRFYGASEGRPNQLTIELRGLLARRPVAFWDGCAFKP